MELKPYQQLVIEDLERFLLHLQSAKDLSTAFHDYWTLHPRSPLTPFPETAIEPYKLNVPACPHICIKVPTAGGKTFIACNAIGSIFDSFPADRPKAVVWMVPSITILEQTLKNLRDPEHPYRQKLNMKFAHRVEVFEKQALLQGTGFNPSSVREQLSIIVMSFDSLRAKNKEDRKVYQENSNLQTFTSSLGTDDDISLMSVIQSLNPVLVVDESHNAESELSVEMLRNLNPCCILDLTATPRKNSNIISFVDALELKKENMVKLPVIVYNHHDKTEVVISALQLQRKLESAALEEEANGGRYIRPIVLFQAQAKTASDNTTFEKLKEKLIELKIPAEQIKIKTASINEIKDIDLMSRNCPVRFIITVNALKEGWDCPFAYVLASLADKSSSVDVEQILGRVLRQPYVTKHVNTMLNMSYVLTASMRFMETLDNIVKGLNRAGFSSQDYRLAESVTTENVTNTIAPIPEQVKLEVVKENEDIDTDRVIVCTMGDDSPEIKIIEQEALIQSVTLDQTIRDLEKSGAPIISNELKTLVKTLNIKSGLKDIVENIHLPQFFIRKPAGTIFEEEEIILSKEELQSGFQLGLADAQIQFDAVSADLYKVDLDETRANHTPSFIRMDGMAKDRFLNYILDPTRKESRVKNVTERILSQIGNMYPITESEIRQYITKIVERFDDAQFQHYADHDYTYGQRIKEKVKALTDEFAQKKFFELLTTEKIVLKESYHFPAYITPLHKAKDLSKSLYESEADMEPYEEKFISEIAALENVLFWTRNVDRRNFCLNGFINHYPDFIIYTSKGKVILVETKGDDRDNSDSDYKIKLGRAWEEYDKKRFRYFMIFDKKEIPGALTKNNFLQTLREM